jgi:hypothetical protein
MQMLSNKNGEPSILAGTPFEAFGKALSRLKDNDPSQVYARLPYDIEIR